MTQSRKVKNVYTTPPRRAMGGFTIVELIVAATIILIAITAVIAVIRKSTDLQVEDSNRRMARAFIMEKFETMYATRNSAFAGTTNAYSVYGRPSDEVYGESDFTDEPVLTPGVKIADGTKNAFTANMGTKFEVISFGSVSTHRITITLTWTENDGAVQTLSMSKHLAGWAE